MRESRHRYSTVSILLHWAIVVLVLANVTMGGWMEDAEGLEKLRYFTLHKSIGITVFALTLIRVGWRVAHPWPAFPDAMARWERILARGTHVSFYILLLLIPLLGWAAASAGGAPPVDWFGLVPAPNLPVPESDSLSDRLGDMHKLLVKLIYVVIALHVAGALKHHFVNRDLVLHRMLPLIPPMRRRD